MNLYQLRILSLKQVNSSSSSKSKPKIRQATIDDFDKVYPLLLKMNNTRLAKKDWFRLFENHWGIEKFSPGMVLQLEDEIVGYIGTIYSQQIIAGEQQLCCNLTTWIVEDDYRSYSIMMLLPLVRNKKLLLTSFSSNNISYEVYKKLGFKDANIRKRIVYQLPFSFFDFFKINNYLLFTDIEGITKNISLSNKVIFNDHKNFGNTYMLLKHKNKECLLMGVSRDQIFRLTYASNKVFLQKYLKYFRYQIMSQLHVKQVHIDEDLLQGLWLFLSRKVTWGNPYQYKSQHTLSLSPSPEYSEFFLLNM